MMAKRIIIPAVVILLLLVVGTAFLNRGKEIGDTESERPVPVEVVTVEKGDMVTGLTYSGTVQDEYSAALSAKVSAQVNEVYVTEGDKATKGTVLAELDHKDFDLKLETAQAGLRAAVMNADYSGVMREKLEMLLDEGAISRQQYDEADLKYRLAKAEVQRAEANIKELEGTIENHYIRAPRDGIVTEVPARQGDMAMPGKPLVAFSGGTAKKIVVSVVQEDLRLLDENTPAVVTWGQESFDTKVARVLPSVDPATGTAAVELPCEESGLTPGMAVEVEFITSSKKDVMLIPSEAVADTGDGTFVYVVEEDTALLTPITTGAEDKGFTEVVSGLEEGQGIACGDLDLLKHNCSVYVVGGGTS
jgi:RND family efflux transporter MFP subunit